eukprot:6217599-Prymnesium_polylepis.1
MAAGGEWREARSAHGVVARRVERGASPGGRRSLARTHPAPTTPTPRPRQRGGRRARRWGGVGSGCAAHLH